MKEQMYSHLISKVIFQDLKIKLFFQIFLVLSPFIDI